MTAKEKATELIKSYISICNSWNESYVEEQSVEQLKKSAFNTQWWIPKTAALKTCDVMIEHCSQVEPFSGVDFWSEVKCEINAF